jgi:hypothetical protein
MKVLFLDCDGVLNDENDLMITGDQRPFFVLNFKKLSLLKDIIAKSGCKVVLSSSWRNMTGGKETLENHDIEIFGITKYLGGIRGYEIQDWLDNNGQVTNYAILDDDGDMLIHQRPHFIQTDPKIGLNETMAYRTLMRLEMPMTKSVDQILNSIDGDHLLINYIRDLLNGEFAYGRSK